MKNNILFMFFLAFSFYGFSQSAGKEVKKEAPSAVQMDPHMSDESVARYYYDGYNIKDFFKKYPDYPRFINTGDMQHDVPDYMDRVYKWVNEHPDFKEMIYGKPEEEQEKSVR